jgi:hypothetical protein
MAERDATVAQGAEPRPVAPRQPGETGPDQDELTTGPAAGDAPAEVAGATADGAAAAGPPPVGEPAEGPSGEAPDGTAAAAGSAEDPTPGITGTDEPPSAGGTGPNATPAGGAEASGTPSAAANPPENGHAESPSEGPAEGEAEPGEAVAGAAAASGVVALRDRGEIVVVPDAPFPTEESLAEQESATTQLRRAIDELRQMLDVDAVPPPSAPSRRRWGPWLLLLAVIVSIALVATSAVLIATRGDEDTGTDTGTAAPAPSASATPSASASPAATAGDANLPAPLTPAPGTAPESGPGVTVPGTLLVVRLADDASLEITEQAVLPAAASEQIPLGISDVRRLGGEIAGLRPEVTELRASLDGKPAPIRAAAPGSWFVPVSGGPTKVAVSYTLRDAVVTTPPPTENGRVLALVTPLLGRALTAQGLPLTVRTTGTTMLGATCPDAPAALQLCGVGDGEGNWTATVPASVNPVVTLQADLPAAAATPTATP